MHKSPYYSKDYHWEIENQHKIKMSKIIIKIDTKMKQLGTNPIKTCTNLCVDNYYNDEQKIIPGLQSHSKTNKQNKQNPNSSYIGLQIQYNSSQISLRCLKT